MVPGDMTEEMDRDDPSCLARISAKITKLLRGMTQMRTPSHMKCDSLEGRAAVMQLLTVPMAQQCA